MKLIFKILLLFVEAFLITSTEHEGKFLFRRQQQQRDVKFFLYTRENAYTGQELIYGDENLLYKSNINPSVPTRFLLHGWNGDMDTPFNEQVTIEFLMKDDVNVIRVDWSELARSVNYLVAANRVPDAGLILAKFIDFLHFYNAIDFNTIKIVGFSLGAQVAGFTGKNVQRGKIHTIIALDPAGPSFAHRNADGRLDSTDAVYVEVIHTNMGMTGMTKMIGHADFIANSGTMQPGCLLAPCSHQRARRVLY